MHPYSQMAVDLKKAGYPQDLTKFDNVYLPISDQYVRYLGEDIPEEWVLVPSPVSVMGKLMDENYTIKHVPAGDGKEKWFIEQGFVTIESDSLGIALYKFWIYKKGKK